MQDENAAHQSTIRTGQLPNVDAERETPVRKNRTNSQKTPVDVLIFLCTHHESTQSDQHTLPAGHETTT